MAEFNRKLVILILTFWIFVPTLDMVSDMTMVIRLFRGPELDRGRARPGVPPDLTSVTLYTGGVGTDHWSWPL